MPSWFRPALGLLLLGNGVAVVGYVVGFVRLPPPGAGGPLHASLSFEWRHLLPFLLGLVFVLMSWWCSRRTETGRGMWSVAASTTLAVATVLTLTGIVSGPWPGSVLGGSARSG